MSFIAPCTEHYGCSPGSLVLYSRDPGKVYFVQCRSCNIIWKDTTTATEERSYDETYFANRGYDKNLEHRIQKSHMLLALLEQHTRKGRLLEIGPALGYTMMAAQERGWRTEGLDISDYVIQNAPSWGLDIQKGSLTEHDKKQSSYKAIVLRHVLEHYKDPFKAMQEVHGLLAEDGSVLIALPNADYTHAKRLREKHKFYKFEKGGKEHYAYFTYETIKRMLEHTGFDVMQENIPVLVQGDNSPARIIDRTARRALSALGLDQELIVVAKKR